MGASTAYVKAILASAMTAGIGAASVVPAPEQIEAQRISDADLAAVTIPIIDIGPTGGPLSIWRYLAIEAGTNPLLLGLIQEAGNSYNLPGLQTLFNSNTTIEALATSVAGEYVDFGLTSGGGGTGAWQLLGIVGGSSNVDDSRNVHFRPLLGGSRGLGAALYGTLSDSNYTRNFSVLGSNLDITGNRTLLDFNSVTAFTPGGYKSVLTNNPKADPSLPPPPATLIDANPDAKFNLGSLTGSAGGNGSIVGGGGLCLGSLSSCGGNISYATVGAPVTGAVKLGNTEIASADFANNALTVALKPGQFSVKGAVGGNFSIGGLQIGPENGFPIDIQIPRSSMTTLRQQSVRDSFMAVPGKSASDNATSGRHRPGPLRQAVSEIKKAVNEAVSGNHAATESED